MRITGITPPALVTGFKNQIMAKKKKEITSRVVRQTRATKRLFQEVVWDMEVIGTDKTSDQIADDCFEIGVNVKAKMLRDGK